MGDEDATRIAEARKTKLTELQSTLRRELEWIPLKALRKERTERYSSAEDLADDVRRYLVGEPLEAGPESASYRFRKLVRRNKGPFIAVAAVLVVLIAGIVATTIFAIRAAEESHRATALAESEAAQRVEADKQRALAEERTLEAEKQRALALRKSYLASLRGAAAALEHREYVAARAGLTDAWRASSGEPGWEWSYLSSLLNQSLGFTVDARSGLNLRRRMDLHPVTKQLVTQDERATVIWDVQTGQPIERIEHAPRPDGVFGSSFFMRPDGPRRVDIVACPGERSPEQLRFSTFLAGYDQQRGNCLVISDAVTGEEIRRIGTVEDDYGHLGAVKLNQFVVVYGGDRSGYFGTSYLINLDTGDAIQSEYRRDRLASDRRCEVTRLPLSRSVDGVDTLEVFDRQTSERVKLFPNESIDVSEGDFRLSPDSRHLVGVDQRGRVAVWDTRVGGGPLTFWVTESHGSSTWNGRAKIAWSSDGEKLATWFNNTIRLWDMRIGALQRTIPLSEGPAPWNESLLFSETGEQLFAWSGDTITVVDAVATDNLHEGWADLEAHAVWVAWDQVVACGPFLLTEFMDSLNVYDARTREHLFRTRFAPPEAPDRKINLLASPSGYHVAVLSEPRADPWNEIPSAVEQEGPVIVVLDLRTGIETCVDGEPATSVDGIPAAWMGPDRLLYWGTDGELHAYRPSTGRSELVEGPGAFTDEVPRHLIARTEPDLFGISLMDWSEEREATLDSTFSGFVFQGADELDHVGIFQFKEEGRGEPLMRIGNPAGTSILLFRPGLVPGPRSGQSTDSVTVGVLSESTNSELKLNGITIRNGELRGNYLRSLTGISSPVSAAAWSPTGSLLATGHKNGSIRLWDGRTGESTFVGHGPLYDATRAEVSSLAFTTDGTSLAATFKGGGSGLRLLDTISAEERTALVRKQQEQVAIVGPLVERLLEDADSPEEAANALAEIDLTADQRLVAQIELLKRLRPLRAPAEAAYIHRVYQADFLSINDRWRQITDGDLPEDVLEAIAALIENAEDTEELRWVMTSIWAQHRVGNSAQALATIGQFRDLLAQGTTSLRGMASFQLSPGTGSQEASTKYREYTVARHNRVIALSEDNGTAWLVATALDALMRELRPDDVRAQEAWQALYDDLNRLAREVAEGVVERIPPDADPMTTASYVNTLGVTQYRDRQYEQAIESLERSHAIYMANEEYPYFGNLLFIAMAHYQLGEHDRARTLLAEAEALHEAIPQEDFMSTPGENERFLREARELIGSSERPTP